MTDGITCCFFWAGLTAPGDLQSFIEQVSCESGQEDLVLAFSLFYDQLQPHRLTEPWRSEQLLRLLRIGFQTDSARMECVCGPIPLDMKVIATAVYLRLRLPEETNFDEAVSECLKLSNIGWRKAATCHPSVLFNTWSFFATQSSNEDDLRAALDKGTWVREMPSDWLMFPATWGISEAASGTGTLSVKDFVAILGESCPELKPRLPFFLLGALINFRENKNPDSWAERDTNLLLTLESVMDREVDPSWLQLSTAFVRHSYDDHHFDLLMKSFAMIENLQAHDQVDPTLISTARNYVKKLIIKRDRRSKSKG